MSKPALRVASGPGSLAEALDRWQEAAGPLWIYVGAAPFLGETPPGRRPRPSQASRCIELLIRGLLDKACADPPELWAIYGDLPPEAALAASALLWGKGVVTIPVVQRWVASPARIRCAGLTGALVAYAPTRGWQAKPRALFFALDGERQRTTSSSPHALDNRYRYGPDRLPPAELLRALGVTRAAWIGGEEIAEDLMETYQALCDAGLAPRPLTLPLEIPAQRIGALRTRALVNKPTAATDGAYREFVREAQTQGLLADHLVRGEPYLARNAVLLTADDVAQLKRLTTLFSRACLRAARELAADPTTLEAMGFPWAAAELLTADEVQVPTVGRFDFVQDEDRRWWLLEFNADTPSGIREAIVVDRLVWESLPQPVGRRRPNERLAERIVAAFGTVLGQFPRGSRLGLLTDAAELEDLAQMAFTERLLREPLARLGVEIVLGDVDDLRATRSGVSLRGWPIAALYRYVPFETSFGTPTFSAIYDAVMRGRLLLINGLGGLLLQHKGLLAWLWAHRGDSMLPASERAAIERHLPPTWWIDAVPDNVSSMGLVAKQVFGREGEEVFFGEDLSQVEWAALVGRRTYVAQQRVQVAWIEAAVETALGTRSLRGYPTVGCFAVAGRWAGFYTRVGGKITTSRAKWLATFRE